MFKYSGQFIYMDNSWRQKVQTEVLIIGTTFRRLCQLKAISVYTQAFLLVEDGTTMCVHVRNIISTFFYNNKKMLVCIASQKVLTRSSADYSQV